MSVYVHFYVCVRVCIMNTSLQILAAQRGRHDVLALLRIVILPQAVVLQLDDCVLVLFGPWPSRSLFKR